MITPFITTAALVLGQLVAKTETAPWIPTEERSALLEAYSTIANCLVDISRSLDDNNSEPVVVRYGAPS